MAWLRARIDDFLPEFEQLFASLLLTELGPEGLQPVLAVLESPLLQAHAEASAGIDREVIARLPALRSEMLDTLAPPEPASRENSGKK